MPYHRDDERPARFEDPDPEEIPRCRHGVMLDEYGSSRNCDDCQEQIGQEQSISADAATPYAVNH